MCLQPNSHTAKKAYRPASLKFPQLFTLGRGQEQGHKGTKGFDCSLEPSADPMTRWLRELPITEPWHGFDVSAYSGQKEVFHPKQRPATSSSTGATTGGEKRRAEVH